MPFTRFGLARNSVALRTGEMQPEADDTSLGRTETGRDCVTNASRDERTKVTEGGP